MGIYSVTPQRGVNDTDAMATQRPSVTDGPAYENAVVWLFLPVILIAGSELLYLWVGAQHSVACSVNCDYALAYAAKVRHVIAVAIIAAVTLAALITWRKRSWKTWPIALAGIVLMSVATVIADHVIRFAYPH